MNKKLSLPLNVLITSAGRKVPLIQGFKKACALYGGKVIAVDLNPSAVGLQFADQAYLVPAYTDTKFIPSLLAICRRHCVKLVIPTKDKELSIFAENKDRFATIGATVMVADPSTIAVANDKLKFVEFCQKHGLPAPKTYSSAEIKTGRFSFPLFINSRYGAGSREAHRLNSRFELNFYLKKITAPIIQEFVSWPEYTLDLFADFAGRVISVVPRQRIFTVSGESYVGKTVNAPVLLAAAKKLAEKLKLVGHNNIQCFFDGRRVKFIEVNARFGGGSNLSFAAGAPTPQYLLRLLQGEKIKSRLGLFQKNLLMLRHTEDLFLPARKIKIKKYA